MRRTVGFEVLACPRCGGRLGLVALIEQASVVQRILRHLGLPTEVPEPRPARAPPRRLEPLDDQSQDAPEFDAARARPTDTHGPRRRDTARLLSGRPPTAPRGQVSLVKLVRQRVTITPGIRAGKPVV